MGRWVVMGLIGDEGFMGDGMEGLILDDLEG